MSLIRAGAKLDGLQTGRAVAALMVVAFHANVFILPDRLLDGASAARAFNMGYAGVEFFFVLSGFIMYYAHARDFSKPERAQSYMWRRIMRIYPIYWIVFLALIALYFMMPERGPDNARDPFAIVTSLLLIPMPELPIMRVAWTLQHEMLFYLVFVLLILHRRWGGLVFAVWMAMCIVAALFEPLRYPFDFLLSAYNVLFLMGIAAGKVFGRIPARHAGVILVSGVVIFFAVGLAEVYGIIEWNKPLRTWGYGIGASLATAALAAGAIRAPRWLVYLGDASYSIYLTHLPVMGILAVALRKIDLAALPAGLVLVLVGGLATAVGAAVYALVERPLLQRLKRPSAQVHSARPSEGQ